MDIIAADVAEVLLSVFTRYYNELSNTPAGDVVRGPIGWATAGLSATWWKRPAITATTGSPTPASSASCRPNLSEEQLRWMRELTREDFRRGSGVGGGRCRAARTGRAVDRGRNRCRSGMPERPTVRFGCCLRLRVEVVCGGGRGRA
jgi:hypothetical protein